MTRFLTMATLLLFATEAAATRPTKGRPLVTGQAADYGAAGERTSGMSRMFNDLGNGVIKDQRTGLFWEKKSDDGSIHDKDDAYTWSPGSPWLASGTAFGQFLATLNTPPCFGNFCDWRLPTIQELESLRNFGRSPAIHVAFDSGCTAGCAVTGCSCTSTYYHYSSTTSFDYPDAAWYMHVLDGTSDYGAKTFPLAVRAVRGGAVTNVATPTPAPTSIPTPTPAQRFVDLGLVVEDTLTGDWWEKKTDDGSIHDKDQSVTWATANDHVGSMSLAQFAGRAIWCLPSREKLNGIVDLARAGCGTPPLTTPCISGTFDPTSAGSYWTSEPSGTSAWVVNFATGGESLDPKSSNRYFRAISSTSCL